MYLLDFNSLNLGDFRLLEVDTPLLLRSDKVINFFVSSSDVLHSFALPALSVKIDAIPGRINVQNSNRLFPGIFYGQCSEICGTNHSFMPVTLEVV